MIRSIEKRSDVRLPFTSRVLFSNDKGIMVAHGLDLSRGGMFVRTLDTYSIDDLGILSFTLPGVKRVISVKSRIAHIIFDKQRCEIECGLGIQFHDLSSETSEAIRRFLSGQKEAYRELQTLLSNDKPNLSDLSGCLSRIPSISEKDILGLRYRVNRICTLLEDRPT